VNPKTSDILDATGPRHATWDTSRGAHPADPVSAVLMREQLLNYYVLDQATKSETDWVVTMPTKPFYTDIVQSGTGAALPPFEAAFTTGGAPDYFGIAPTTLLYRNPGDTALYDREGRYPVGAGDFGPNPPPPTIYFKRVANVLSFFPDKLF